MSATSCARPGMPRERAALFLAQVHVEDRHLSVGELDLTRLRVEALRLDRHGVASGCDLDLEGSVFGCLRARVAGPQPNRSPNGRAVEVANEAADHTGG